MRQQVVLAGISDTVGPRMRRHCCAQSAGSAPTVARARARRQCLCHALAVSRTHHRVILRSFCARSAGSAPAVARALAALMIVQRAHCVCGHLATQAALRVSLRELAHSSQQRSAGTHVLVIGRCPLDAKRITVIEWVLRVRRPHQHRNVDPIPHRKGPRLRSHRSNACYGFGPSPHRARISKC